MSIALRLLVLEDESNDAELAIAVLDEAGYGCQWERVETREDFLARLDSPDYDLILADYKLPSFDGLTALELVSERGIDVPFIMISGTLGEEAAIESLKAGATDYVLKNRLSRLAPVVKRALKEQAQLRQRQRAEEALRDEKTFIDTAVNSIQDIFYVFDSNGKLLRWNTSMRQVTGYGDDEIAVMQPLAFFAGEDRQRVEDSIESTVQQGRAHVEAELVRKDGTRIPYEFTGSLLTDSQGEVVGVCGCGRDVTERKAAERALRASESALQESYDRLQETLDELRATREQVIQQERLRALGEMASGVGHDLNNSLSPVLGYSEMLLEDSRLPGDACQFLKWIRDGARDAAAIVTRLREFYRPSDPGESRRPVELAGLLEQVVQLTRPKWRDEAQREGRKIEVQTQSEDAPFVLGNEAEIREVLTNLVFNAVDALPSGGRIVLRLRGESGDAVVEVSDTGAGMSDEVRAKCFEPFFTTKGRKGTGLGLSVCHGIVQRHGGRIEIDSPPEQGTTVRVLLPAAEGRPAADEEPEADASLPVHRVLCIDDDPRARSVVGDMLRLLGQEVDLAGGGVRGLELVGTNDYDLVITDRGMPEMDGCTVTGKIKALRPKLPVAMLTGWGTSGPAGSEEPRSVPDYILSKPLRLDEMRQLLAKLTPERGATGIGRADEMGPSG